MAFIICQSCGKQYSDKAPACPFCKSKPGCPPSLQKEPAKALSSQNGPRVKAISSGAISAYKPFRANCPMCAVNLTMEVEPDAEPTEYPSDWSLKKLGTGDCPFCKTILTIVTGGQGYMSLRDTKWDEQERIHTDRVDLLEEEISTLEDLIEMEETEDGDACTQKQIDAAEKRLKTLKKQLETIEQTFNDKSEKYYDRQLKWQEKADNKFGETLC